MTKSAADFLNDLAERELVPDNIVASLHRQVTAATKPVSAASIARLLVEKGHLTAVQAERLLGSPLHPAVHGPTSASATAPATASAPVPPRPQPIEPLPETKLLEPDELGLAPLEDVPASTKKAPQPAAASTDSLEPLELGLLNLMPLNEATAPAAPKSAAATPGTAPKRPAAQVRAPAAPVKKPLAPPLTPLEPLSLEPLPLDVLAPLESPLTPMQKPAPVAAVSPAARSAPSQSAAVGPLPPASAAPALAARAPSAVTVLRQAPSRIGRWIGLIVGGLVLLAVAATLAIWLLLPRGGGEKEFELAQQEYQAKRYAAAVESYAGLLDAHPAHPQASLARVRLGLARILAAKDAQGWSAALPVARKVLVEIDQEPELAQVHGELAPLLTEMVQELIKQASAAGAEPASKRLAAARDALTLANNGRYLPGTLRAWQQLSEAEESLDALEREQASAIALEKFVGAADTLIAAGDLAKLSADRDELLPEYPELRAKLDDVGKRMAKAAAAAVQPTSELPKGTAEERQSAVDANLTLVHQPAATTPGPAGTFLARAGASIWALDSAGGKVLWRRPVGIAPGFEPVRLPAESAGVLLVDARHQELLCVDERTGKLRWRHSFGSPIAGSPLAAVDKVLVTTRSGRVTALSAASGDAVAAAALPSAAAMPAAAGAGGRWLYQLADRDYLYVLSPGELKCERAVYLGHREACVDVPPLVLGGRLIVTENRGVETALLHVVPLDDTDLPHGESQHVEIQGQVVTQPVVLQVRLLVLTDRGAVVVLEIPAQPAEPLVKIAESSLETTGSWLRFGVVVGNRLCVADLGLSQFDFTPASGSLKLRWSSQQEGAVQSPPQLVGDVLFGVRQTVDGAGWIASAVKASDGQPLWETLLAMPLVDLYVAEGAAHAVSSSGASVTVPLADLTGRHSLELSPRLVEGKSATIAASIPFAGERRIVVPAGQPRELLLIEPGQAPRSISVPDPLAGMPVAVAGGLIVPCTSGAIYWLNADGMLAAGPIQMSMAAGTRLALCSCATVGDSGDRLVVSDGLGALYHLAIEKNPQPQLKMLATARLSAPPISRIAVLADHVHVVERGGKLLSLALPDLEPAGTQQLDAHAVEFGPERVADMLLLATERQDLVSIERDGSIRWRSLLNGNLAGSPVESASTVVAATREGVLFRLAAASGKELARVELNEPLLGSPVVAGSDVLVSTADGVLLKVVLPNKQETAP